MHLSLQAPCAWLALHAEADIRGRIRYGFWSRSRSSGRLTRDLGCLNEPYAFSAPHVRPWYFADPKVRRPDTVIFDTTQFDFTMTILSGLPGAGKSRWIECERAGGMVAGQPVVHLDQIRAAMGVDPGDNQGTVRQEALAQSRHWLATRRSFVWDGLNLDRDRRGPLCTLARNYGVRIQLVYLERPEVELRARNRARAQVVPDAVVDRMLRHWEPPSLAESHEMTLVLQDPPRHFPKARMTSYAYPYKNVGHNITYSDASRFASDASLAPRG